MEYTLICRVISAEKLFSPPNIVWMDSNRDNITVGPLMPEGAVTTRNLTFDPLRTSHGEIYTCMANITIPEASVAVMSNNSTTINVQSEFGVLLHYAVLFHWLVILVIDSLYQVFISSISSKCPSSGFPTVMYML